MIKVSEFFERWQKWAQCQMEKMPALQSYRSPDCCELARSHFIRAVFWNTSFGRLKSGQLIAGESLHVEHLSVDCTKWLSIWGAPRGINITASEPETCTRSQEKGNKTSPPTGSKETRSELREHRRMDATLQKPFTSSSHQSLLHESPTLKHIFFLIRFCNAAIFTSYRC